MRASGRSRAPAFLDRLGLTLEESYDKMDYDQLSRLDARNFIDALTFSLEHRYESQTTKSPELNFSSLVDDNGVRNVRFEWAFRT
jgi:hypothetical protein